MNSPRSLRSPRGASKEAARPFVYLLKVDFPDDEAVRIRLPKEMKELLVIATEVLELVRPAKQVFIEGNIAITDIADIEARSTLYISCCEPAANTADEPVYKSRLPKPSKTATALKLPMVKQPKPKAKREDAAQHQAIAASPFTVKENLRDSLLALYASLTSDHKAQLSCTESLQKLADETRAYSVEDALLSQFIGPTSVIAGTRLGKETTQWMMEQLKGLKPSECRFAVMGPPQSGKSTLLSIAVNLFFQKCQISGDTQNYLVVPINWSLQQIYIDDIQKMYGVMVTATFDAIRGSRFELIPVLGALQQWFMSLVTIPALPPLPPSVLHFKPFPQDIVTQIGGSIHKAWNNRAGLYDFFEAALSLPKRMAVALGFISVVMVMDHFDACGFVVEPPRDRFAESTKVVQLPELVCKVIGDDPFFIASKEDAEFIDMFKITDYRQLSTERIVAPVGGKELLVTNPRFSINEEMCKGFPAYCAMYERLCEMAETASERVGLKSQFSKLRAVVDISRAEALRQELLRTCLLLAAVDTEDTFNEDIMNQLSTAPDVAIKVR